MARQLDFEQECFIESDGWKRKIIHFDIQDKFKKIKKTQRKIKIGQYVQRHK